MSTFDPGSRGFPLQTNFNRTALQKMLAQLEPLDASLARQLREELLGGSATSLTRASFEQLLKLSQTNGIYSPLEDVARRIGGLLFGRPLG